MRTTHPVYTTSHGYRMVRDKSHPNANTRGDVYEHVVIAARALGRPLPSGVEVHHVNGIGTDNRNGNLVICESHGYHYLLHARKRAYEATGNASLMKCVYCKVWDKDVILEGKIKWHKQCRTAEKQRYDRARWLARHPRVDITKKEKS